MQNNTSSSFFDPLDIKNPYHFAAIYLTVLFFIALNIAVIFSPYRSLDKTNTAKPTTKSENILGVTSEQYVRNLTPYADNQDDAVISGNKVAWLNHTDGNNRPPALTVTDLLKNTKKQITNQVNPYGQSAFDIDGNKVVWTYKSTLGGPTDIYFHDLSTSTTTKITSDGCDSWSPSISGNKIVYTSNRNNGCSGIDVDIYLYDLANDTERRLTSGLARRNFLGISGDKIVYQQGTSPTEDVYLYELANDSITSIAVNAQKGSQRPDISGTKIVWQDNRNPPDMDIYLYDIVTKTTQDITNNTTNEFNARISGNNVVWKGYKSGSVTSDIFLYDLLTKKETKLTYSSTNQLYPDVSGSRITWRDERNGNSNLDIYIYDPPEKIPPSTPVKLRVTGTGTAWVSLVWWASKDSGGSGLAGYKVYRGKSSITSTKSTTYTDKGLSPATSYSYYVRAYDKAGNLSNGSNIVSATTLSAGSSPPSEEFKKVKICHRKASSGFETITVSNQATLTGHLAHPGDIIPATKDCKPSKIEEVLLPDVFRRKNSKTTDLSKVKDPKKVKGFTIDSLVNTIKFAETLDLSSQATLNKLNYLNLYLKADKLGVISLDSKKLPELNKKATLTMKKLPHVKTPRVLVDGDEDAKVISNIKYDRGILDFDVTHFSTFTAAPRIAINSPSNNFQTEENSILIKGTITDPTAKISVILNDKPVGGLNVDESTGNFEKQLSLKKGTNTVLVKAVSSNGEQAKLSLKGQLVEKPNYLPIYLSIGGFIVAVLVVISVYYWRNIRKIIPKKSK